MKFHNLKTCLLTLIRRQNQPYRRQLSATTLRCSRDLPADGPGLRDFIKPSHPQFLSVADDTPYLQVFRGDGRSRKVFFEVYGCQMNVNDTEIVWSILKGAGFVKTDDIQSADVILLMTCSIRDNAEKKIWNRLTHLAALKRERVKHKRKPPIRIGILGCMAERLKTAILEKDQFVDLVAGPDSYKDLPRLLSIADDNQKAINVILSQDETYADVTPVRLNENSITAYVSIMRGCDNMCTYCIVPFTRGRERSRPIDSILSEVKSLSEQGVKEVTLLGQNVNSYRDLSRGGHHDEPTHHPKGFKTVYKPKKGGLRFADLLSEVASVDPQMRIRFTSPHPKDFPDDVLEVMSQRPNLCCNIHLPAQSGSNTVLDRMRRGYTREAYLELVHHIRDRLPGVTLSSDFICGFCGETDEEFAQTLTLLETVKYNVAYLFAYSMREKTTAHRRYLDDVPPSVKNDRLQEMVRVFRREADVANRQFLGKRETVLIEGPSKRSNQFLAGRNDGNIKVIVPDVKVPKTSEMRAIKPGDYIAVQITETNSQVLKGEPMRHTRLLET